MRPTPGAGGLAPDAYPGVERGKIMAMARTASGMRAGGQILRDIGGRVGHHSSSALSRVTGFFRAYPPLAQGLYFLLTGLWQLLSISSFQAVTGPKHDLWLV